MNRGFNKRGRSHRQFSRNFAGNDAKRGNRGRHPSGLKGREIGLWYARQRTLENTAAANNFPSLALNAQEAITVDEIMSVISNDASSNTDWDSNINMLASKSYETIEPEEVKTSTEELDILGKIENMKESRFKNMYMKNIQGNKRKMGLNSEDAPIKEFKFVRSASIDKKRAEELKQKFNNDKFNKMFSFRKKLPSYNMKEVILSTIDNNQAIVLSGETGCGKTTQVPQFILDDIIQSKGASTCRIVCTQPRRISAISVAKRVADERAEALGVSVGYQIRLEKVLPRDVGSITYCTTGMVLQWLQTDPFLSEISHLILDEVHERDSLSDFLLCVAKDILPYRPNLKLILMSATLNADKFSSYYGNCPKLHIPGYTFPVEEYYLEDVIENLRYSFPDVQIKKRSRDSSFQNVIAKIDYMRMNRKYSQFTVKQIMREQSERIDYQLIVELLKHINRQAPGAVLVFLPGWEEISSIHKLLEKDRELGAQRCLVIPLHSMMPTVNQREVFDRPPKGIRKIVLATNIAETSITIDDVVYVIDTGKIKLKNYNKENKVATLQSEWVALANAKQRKGRAGRVTEGVCYHLYTRARESLLDEYHLPEIQRTNLEEVVLNVKILQLGLCSEFLSKIMEPPDDEVLQISLKLLKSIRALDSDENLTPLGYHLARLPVDPFIGKMLLMGALLCCVDPILTIAAALAFKDPFVIPLNKEKQVNQVKSELDSGLRSDHLLLVKIYDEWSNATKYGHGDRFARDHFISVSIMYQLSKLRKDFMKILREHNFINTTNPYDPDVNRNSHDFAVVKAAITAGLYPNVARIITGFNGRANYFSTPEGRVGIHLKSVNADERLYLTQWLVYWQKMRTSMVYLYDTTMVDNFAILFFGEKLDYDDWLECINVDNFVKVKCDKKIYNVIQKLRDELDSLLEHKISHPTATNWDPYSKEGYLLKLIITLLSEEHLG